MNVIRFETERYVVEEPGGRLTGREKPHPVLTDNARVFVQAIEGDARAAATQAMKTLGFDSIIAPGDRVAVKVNLGGGIAGVPSSYTEPAITAGVVDALKSIGAKPFLCEADMRAWIINDRFLRRRGYLDLLKELDVEFVNLSRGETVEFTFDGLDPMVLLPAVLLDPAVKIISVPSPKHHWECGVTLAQKNMYGAIAEQRKSIYHFHGQSILDRVVAGAARIMKPCISVIGATQLCGGLGPHLCVPIDFHRIIIGNDMLAADAVAAGFLNFPYDQVKHATINLGEDELRYELMESSATLPDETRSKIDKHRVKPHQTGTWRKVLQAQYYIPHSWQTFLARRLEFLATGINRRFYASRGDRPAKIKG